MGRSFGWFLLVLGLALRISAQAPGSLDTNFVMVAGTEISPSSLVPLPGNKILAGGIFTNYGGTGRAGVVRLNANGTIDTSFTLAKPLNISDPVIVNGQQILAATTNAAVISGLLVRPDGKIVLAGKVTHLGPVKLAPARLALVNDDGSPAAFLSDIEKLSPGSLLNGPGNAVYVGGDGSLDGGTRLALLRLNPDGSRDNGFTPPTLASLGFQSGNVSALHRGPGETIYAGVAAIASFQGRFEILRLTASGALDPTFAEGGRANCALSLNLVFASTPSGQLVMFNTSFASATYRGATLANPITRLLLDGAVDASFAPPSGLGLIGSGAVQADNKVLVLNSSLGAVARLNENGSKDTSYVNPAKVPVNQLVFAPTKIAVALDGSSFVAGATISPAFQQLYGTFHILGDPNTAPSISTQPLAQTNTLGARTRFTALAQGAAPLSFQWYRGTTPIPGATSQDLILAATTAEDDADFYCLISNSLGQTPTDSVHLTLLPPLPGTVHRETDLPAGPDNNVADFDWTPDGSLLAVGNFKNWNTVGRVGLVRLVPPALEVDLGFNPTAQNSDPGNPFNTVLWMDGKVFACGAVDYTVTGKRYGALRFNLSGGLDSTFLPHTSSSSLVSGFRAARGAMGPDGKVVMWASFWNGENLGGSFLRINPDGTRDTTFALRGSNYAANGGAVAALPDGRYLVSGRPNSVGTQASGVLRLNANGTVDPTFATFSDFNAGEVNQILVLPDGRILLAGTFTYRANTPSPNLYLGLLRILADGGPDRDFNPVPQLCQATYVAQGGFRRMALQADGRILAVASAATGAFPRQQVFRFWPNGMLDPEFQIATNSTRNNTYSISTVAVRALDNAIFLGGVFNEFSLFRRTNFVRLNGGPLRGTPAAPAIASQPTRVVAKNGSSATLTIEPAGEGPFQFQWRRNAAPASTNFVDIIGATNASLILPKVQLSPSDSGLFQCSVVNPGGAVASSYITLLVEPDPALPGMFDASLVAPTFQGILTGQYQVSDANPDGSLYASTGATVVRLFEDGTRDNTFAPPSDLVVPGGGVAVIKRQPDGKLLVAGRLKDGALARLLSDGRYDPDFVRTNRYTGDFQDVPEEMGLQSDGKILLAGTFANFAGRPVTGLIRFHPDGRVDESFPVTGIDNILPNPTRTLPGRVISLRVLADDSMYIGGGFTHVQGAARYGVAKLNADGSIDPRFVPPTNGSSSGGTSGSMLFYQLGPVSPQGGIYIFGQFRPDPSKPGTTALRLNPDGSADPAFQLFTDFQINSGVVQPDQKLIINGQFGQVNNVNTGSLARVNPDGSVDTSWQRAGAGGGTPLQLLPDGKLLAANRRYFTGLGPSIAAPEVAFTLTPGGLKLAWPAGYKLQRATQLVPANWQEVAAPSPYVVPASGPGAFFRAVAN